MKSVVVPPTHGMHGGLRLGADESVAGNVAVQLVGRRHPVRLLHTVKPFIFRTIFLNHLFSDKQ